MQGKIFYPISQHKYDAAENLRPLQCKFCTQSFKYDFSRKMHVKEVHLLPVINFQKQVIFIKAIQQLKEKKNLKQFLRFVAKKNAAKKPIRVSVITKNPCEMK